MVLLICLHCQGFCHLILFEVQKILCGGHVLTVHLFISLDFHIMVKNISLIYSSVLTWWWTDFSGYSWRLSWTSFTLIPLLKAPGSFCYIFEFGFLLLHHSQKPNRTSLLKPGKVVEQNPASSLPKWPLWNWNWKPVEMKGLRKQRGCTLMWLFPLLHLLDTRPCFSQRLDNSFHYLIISNFTPWLLSAKCFVFWCATYADNAWHGSAINISGF